MNEQQKFELSIAYNSYVAKVFGWMFIGLLATALSASITFSSGFMEVLRSSPLTFYGLLIGEFALVAFLSAKITSLSSMSTRLMYFAYATINGATLSMLLAYNSDVAVKAFVTTSIIFGIMAIYGLVTKTDLSGMRSIFFIGILGLIGISIVNFFLQSGPLDYIISYAGLILFLGITAYDTQKLKSYFYYGHTQNPAMLDNLAISGALSLYLDFINIFIFILRIFGRRN